MLVYDLGGSEKNVRFYMDEVGEQGLVVDALASELENNDQRKKEPTVHPSVAANARSLKGKIAPGLCYMSDRASMEIIIGIFSRQSRKSLHNFCSGCRITSPKPVFPRKML
jgi:hypothetical protein